MVSSGASARSMSNGDPRRTSRRIWRAARRLCGACHCKRMPAVRNLSRTVLAAVAVSLALALGCQPEIEGVRLDLMQRGELRGLDFRKMCRRRVIERIGIPGRQLERHL